MHFKQFKYINELNKRDGVHPWNHLIVIAYDDEDGTITLKSVNLPNADEAMMKTNIFINQLIRYHMYYLINVEALKDCTFVKDYIIDRTLYLRRAEKVTRIYAEKYVAKSEEITFKHRLVIDYREPANTKHKYVINLGDFLKHYINCNKDIERTFDFVLKKIQKCVKKIPEIGCLSLREQEWVEKAVEQELNHIAYEVMV